MSSIPSQPLSKPSLSKAERLEALRQVSIRYDEIRKIEIIQEKEKEEGLGKDPAFLKQKLCLVVENKNLHENTRKYFHSLLQQSSPYLQSEDIRQIFEFCSSTLLTQSYEIFKHLIELEELKPLYDIHKDNVLQQKIFKAHCLGGNADMLAFLLEKFPLQQDPEAFYRSVGFAITNGKIEVVKFLLTQVPLDLSHPALHTAISQIPSDNTQRQAFIQQLLFSQELKTTKYKNKDKSSHNKI